ncbi:MAG TPA: ATP-binding protein, partial [Candidatus Obscuribacterales bacterium]
MSFIGRETELSILEQQYGRPGGQLFVVYGRRRVGKTALLNRFCMGKPHVYFTASQSATRDNLHQFAAICQRFLNRPEMQTVEFKTIEGLLQYLNGCAGPEKLVIVLDEYQYWAGGDPSLGSLIQRFWDHSGKQSNVMLVLCGSYISLMVDYALAERSPLYGRRSGQLHVLPFDYRTAARFFPQWSYKDRLMAYGILGGIPAYLEQFDSSMSLPQNILENLLAKGTFLNEEATFLLKTELRDTRMYTSILRAIAAGNTSLKDLASKLGMEGRALSPYLSNLQG